MAWVRQADFCNSEFIAKLVSHRIKFDLTLNLYLIEFRKNCRFIESSKLEWNVTPCIPDFGGL